MTQEEIRAVDEREFIAEFRELDGGDQQFMSRLICRFLYDPGFGEAYRALPIKAEYGCPSKEDVEALMAARGKVALP